MSEPLVSVLMPTYRRPDYLRGAIASVVGQTYKNLQIVVRDNASGDSTPEVVRSFNDPRIDFLQAVKNDGPFRNGMECLRQAKGEYLVQLCDDDLFGNTYVEKLVRHMKEDSGIIAAYGATESIDERGNITGRSPSCGTQKWTAREIVDAWRGGKLPLISGINFMCSTSFAKGLNGSFEFPDGHNSDNAIFMTAGIRGKVLFTDECVFYYRFHSQNSANRHPCHLRAEGDKAFLRYLDAQVKSPLNVSVPKHEWPKIRGELQTMFANGYYQHLVSLRLEADSLSELFMDTVVYPRRVYGAGNAWRLFRANKSKLIKEVRRRARGFRDAGHVKGECQACRR